jgi:aspartyl protease family protein
MGFEDRGHRPNSPWDRPVPAPPSSGRFFRRFFFLAACVLLLLFALVSFVPPRQWNGFEQASLLRYGLIALAVLLGLAASQKSLPRLAGEIGLWLVLMMLLVAGYGYRFELRAAADRIVADLVPSRARNVGHGTVSFARGDDQQFWIDASVDGQPVRFLLDTGASGVVLNRADAERLGFRWNALAFTQHFETANGPTRGAPVQLRQIRIGSISFDRVPATVNEGELRHSLLGMRLLERLGAIEIRNDTLTIRE